MSIGKKLLAMNVSIIGVFVGCLGYVYVMNSSSTKLMEDQTDLVLEQNAAVEEQALALTRHENANEARARFSVMVYWLVDLAVSLLRTGRHAQISEVMGVTQRTVANQMSLALSDLRVLLRPYLPETGTGDEPPGTATQLGQE